MASYTVDRNTLRDVEDGDLVNRARRLFFDDARWRDQCVGGSNGYQQMIRDYESLGESTDGSDIPSLPQIREPINDAISLAAGSNNKTRLIPVETIDPKMSPERIKFVKAMMHRSADVLDRHVNTILAANQWADIRNSVLHAAGVLGSGCVYVGVRHQVDTRTAYKARVLMEKEVEMWDEKDYLLFNKLYHDVELRQVDTRDVFWQQGVTSSFDQDMMRVSIHEKKSVGELRAQYPDKQIMPGYGTYYLDEYEPHETHTGNTVGVVTMWQLEARSEVKVLGDPNNPEARIPFTVFDLVEVKLAGRTVLHKRIYNGLNGPLRLPIVPYYIIESLNHPYGYSMTRALKVTSDYINSLYSLMFEQARKAVSPQSFAIMTSKLAMTDNLEEIVDKLRDGDVVELEANEDVDDIRQIMQSTGQLQSQLNQAPMQAIQMAESLMKRHAANPDRDAIAAASSGRAKETEIAIADRSKTPVQDLVARSDEAIKDLVYENVRVFQNSSFPTTIKAPDGSFGTVMLNEQKRALLPVNHPFTGEPITDPSYVTPVNPMGFVYDPFDYIDNNTQLEMRAQAEGRGDIPITWRARLAMFSQLIASGALKSARTARDYILPDEIAARDDANFQEDMQEQLAMQQQEQQLLGAEPVGAQQRGTSDRQQLANAEAGRNAPQPNQERRDMGQDNALFDQTQQAISP